MKRTMSHRAGRVVVASGAAMFVTSIVLGLTIPFPWGPGLSVVISVLGVLGVAWIVIGLWGPRAGHAGKK